MSIAPSASLDPFSDASVNVLGTLRLLECCRTYGVRKFIFSTTLTHDVGKRSSLQIYSPEIISIQTDRQSADTENSGDDAIFSLPTTLHEYVVSGTDDKPLLLLYLLEKYRLQDKTLIFTHSAETANRLNHLLTQFYKSSKSDVTTAVISSEVPLRTRKKILSSFISGMLNMYAKPLKMRTDVV